MRLKVTVLILCELLVLVRGGVGHQAKFEPDLNNAYGFLQACIEVDKASSPYDWLSVNQAAFFCLGYVSGMTSALDDEGVIELPNHVQPQPGVIREVVVKYLRDHAELLSESTSSLVHRALLDAWGRKGSNGKQESANMHAGKVVDATIKAIIETTGGVKYQGDFGVQQTALISEWQIVKDN